MLTSIRYLFAFLIVALLAAPGSAQDPYSAPDDTWISISGTVESVLPDQFVLDYGEAHVTVEMDDWNADKDGYKVVTGDRVTVSGIIDDDFFERTTIEANSVYVEGLNTYFYASAVDEEDAFVTLAVPPISSSAVVQGTVSSIDRSDGEFTLDTDRQMLTVETDVMPYNPLDDTGLHQIDVGDIVSVTGEIDDDFLEGKELLATSVVKLARESR